MKERNLNVDNILRNLPHGSGIDLDWTYTEGKSYVDFHNGFHVMNDVGYYVGWADFTLRVYRDGRPFRLMFHGPQSHYLARRYSLREYLEDFFAWRLTEILGEEL